MCREGRGTKTVLPFGAMAEITGYDWEGEPGDIERHERSFIPAYDGMR